MRVVAGSGATAELGCGRLKVEIEGRNIIGVDWHDFEGVDIVANLDTTPWWFWAEDGSCSLVVTHQTLEHLRNLIPVMNEVYRICDAGAFVEIVVPYGAGKAALQDPTHVRFFTEMTFRYWEPGFVEAFGDYGIRGYFAMCGQDWHEDGNLWVLLHPLKEEREAERWRLLKENSEDGLVTWPAPPDLLDRRAMLLGEKEDHQ